MGKTLCPDARRASIAILAAAVIAFVPGALTQLVVIVVAAAVGWRWLVPSSSLPHAPFGVRISRRTGVTVLLSFAAIDTALPFLAPHGGHAWQLFEAFFRTGSLV